ncbi:MAG: hypothetical protein ACE5HI_11425 [bacterium]
MLNIFGVVWLDEGAISFKSELVPNLIGYIVTMFGGLIAFNTFAFRYLLKEKAIIHIANCYKSKNEESQNVLVLELFVINNTNAALEINEVVAKGYYQNYITLPRVNSKTSRQIRIDMIDIPDLDKELNFHKRLKLLLNYRLSNSTRHYVKTLSIKV